ncbi:recombinase family protein [Streptomyces sp. URMC 124]|uniref:recombinase family protein n=1 Tax=Streptomyces sp. URMC 124 TaxID=3423405 RepID=UPI003F1C5465
MRVDVSDLDVSRLADIFLRRSTLLEDKATLDEHERVLRAAIEGEGLTVRKVWREEVSASKRGVKRQAFDSAVADVLARATGSLWVFKLDRLSRRGMGHVGNVLDDFERIGGFLKAHMDGLDSRNPNHRIIFAVSAEQARTEAINIGVRTKIGKDAHKPLGHWPGGPAPYGLKSVRLYPDDPRRRSAILDHREAEYATARKMAEMLLDNKTAFEVAAWLSNEGIKTRQGKLWRASTVASWIRTPGVAGLIHQKERTEDPETGREFWRTTGDYLLDLEGKPIRCGKGVVSPEERWTIIAKLNARTQTTPLGFTNKGGKGSRRGLRQAVSLLTGIMGCEWGPHTLVKAGKQYRCTVRAESGPAACKGLYIDAAKADWEVSRRWVDFVSALDPMDDADARLLHEIAREWYGHRDPTTALRVKELKASLTDLDDRLEKLEQAYYILGRFKGEAGERRYEGLLRGIDSQRFGILGELKGLQVQTNMTALLLPEELTESWEAADLHARRDLLRLTVKDLVAVAAKHRGDRTPVRDRIRIEWKVATPDPEDEE